MMTFMEAPLRGHTAVSLRQGKVTLPHTLMVKARLILLFPEMK